MMRSACVCSIIGRRAIRPGLAAACLVTALAAAPSPAPAQCVVMRVNGEAITNDDIEQRRKFNLLAHESPLRKDIIEELIDDRIKVQTLRRYRLDITQKDVDQEFADVAKRMRMSTEQLTQALNRAGINAATFRAKILADMSWRYVVRARFRVPVDDNSATAGTESQEKGAAAEVSYDYTLRPILFLVPRGDAALLEARRKDADALRARFTSCEAGLTEVRAQQGVIIRDIVTKNSSDLGPTIREILIKTEVGHLTPPETIPQGVQLFALCSKKEAKPDAPEKRVQYSHGHAVEKLFKALSNAYIRKLRRQALIEFMPRCRPRLH
jgi:peptidyl-prolyl cis-trans isomerase SurA